MAKGKVMKEIFKKVSKEVLAEQKRKGDLEAIPVRLAHSRKEAAKLLGISLRTLDYLISGGKLKAQKAGRRTFISRMEIESYFASLVARPLKPIQAFNTELYLQEIMKGA